MSEKKRTEGEQEKRFARTLRSLLSTPPTPHQPAKGHKRQERSATPSARERKAKVGKP
jgi:hypothetical protein